MEPMTSSEADLRFERFQLSQCCCSRLPVLSSDSRGLVQPRIEADSDKCESNFFVPLSSTEMFRDVNILREIYDKAHRSEEFFLTVCKGQWLRTMVKFPETPLTAVKEARIHSNVLPCGPNWTDEASRSMQFPCSILNQPFREGELLVDKVWEWKQAGREGCGIDKHEHEVGKFDLSSPLKKFWEIPPDDPDLGDGFKPLSSNPTGVVSRITWRGGRFVRKCPDCPLEFGKEFSAVQRLCHPHIVYIFGSYQSEHANPKHYLYMERMESDLFSVIHEINRPKKDRSSPPFSYHESVDILLQIAKAMAHMHENELIHGDLKSPNVLISQLEISEGQCRYLAKVADFGHTQAKNSKKPFEPSPGTTQWVAPEVIKFREYRKLKDKKRIKKLRGKMIKDTSAWPEKTDIYGFGIIAFEVLTGERPYRGMAARKVRDGLMDGSLKLDTALPLGAICKEYNLEIPEYIMTLIQLIERCWKAPKYRPPFSEIVKELVMVRNQIPVLQEAGASTSNSPLQLRQIKGTLHFLPNVDRRLHQYTTARIVMGVARIVMEVAGIVTEV